MRLIRFLLLAVTLACHSASAQGLPDYDNVYVNDFAGLLPNAAEDRIRVMLEGLYDSHGVEFTVVTLRTMRDYGHTGEIEPFATRLFNEWGVGDAERNDGVMMLVAVDDRQMRIEVGAGYGTSKNAAMQRIIDRDMLPRFRNDDYATGIERGVISVIEDLTGSYPEAARQGFFQWIGEKLANFVNALGGWIFAILAPLVGVPVRAYRRFKRNQPRICPVDDSTMTRLDETWDDNHLQQGQITEERLKSVDYDVWECPQCDHVTIEAYRAWFSRYGACRSCGFRTVEGTTTVLKSATTSRTGLKRIDYNCHNCGDAYSVEKVIPRRQKRSSSSGRSSFGGGRSSGGGASGRW